MVTSSCRYIESMHIIDYGRILLCAITKHGDITDTHCEKAARHTVLKLGILQCELCLS